MQEAHFDSLGLICKITGNRKLINAIIEDKFTYHYMIGAKKSHEQLADVEVVQNDSTTEPVEINYPRATFKGSLSPRDIVVIGEYLLERARQEKKGWYNISSACASL